MPPVAKSPPLWDERVFVALPDEHTLREKDRITWGDLRNEHFLIRQADYDPALCARVSRHMAGSRQTPDMEMLEVSRGTLMHLVALGRGAGLTSEATASTPFPKVIFRPIAGADARLQFCAAWLDSNDNPALRRFLSMARSMAKESK